MPKGPRGEKRPADVVSAAVMVGRIATGEISDDHSAKDAHAVAIGRKGGLKGGKARSKTLSSAQRRKIAKVAAAARWSKTKGQ